MGNGSPEGNQESGGSLREKLEQALAANATITSELVSYKAKDLISANGYKHVTVEDLQGVSLGEIEAKAGEIETQKAAQAEAVLKTVLGSKLGDDVDLDAVIANLLGNADKVEDAALDRIRAVGQQQSLPKAAPAEDPNLTGPARLRAAFAG